MTDRGREPGREPPGRPDLDDWWGGPGRWDREDRRAWRRARRRRNRDHRPGPAMFGCLLAFVVVLVGIVTALSTWVAAAVLGVLAPGAGPSALTAAAVLVVPLLVLAVSFRIFVTAFGPLADLADATTRLADGEPDVRVEPRGPRQVRRLVASFNTMADRMDRSREDRKALLADVTHELRTPLTVIAGGLEAMVDGVHPMDEDHVAPLLAETAVMTRLLEDLRTLSLADAGALALHREPVDLRALADEVVASQAPIATSRGVALTATGDDELVTSVDPVRVREILVNLVANALRHTPGGGSVDVVVRASGDAAVLEVRDTGEGIPPGDLARVFDRFQRRADSGGSGLGLAIVRDLATAHGGTVEVESDGVAGRGSLFRVRLPRRD